MELKKGYKQTEVGIIPVDWQLKTVNEISTINGRVGWKGYTKEDLVEVGPYTIGAKHINKDNKLDLSEPTRLSYSKFIESPEIMVFKNDILIVQRGTIGKVVLIENEIGDATINPSMLILRTKKIPSNFIYYYLISEEGQHQINIDTSSTGVPMITQKQVLSFKIPIPSTIEEQKGIAQVLTDTDQLIQNLKTLIGKKKAIKRGTMQELLTGEKRLKGFYGEWKIKKLGEIADIKGGGTPSTNISEFWNGNIDWFTPTEVGKSKYVRTSKRKITQVGFENCSATLFPVGTILLTTRAGIGDLAILTKEACTNQGFQSFIIGEDINNEFVYYRLKTLKSEFASKASGSTFQEISPNNLKSIEISIPELNEQKAIAQILSDMDSEIEALETQLQKTQSLKQGMMQELLTGKIRLVNSVGQSTKKELSTKVKAKSKIKTFSIATEPEKDYIIEKPRNEHITDAVLIGTMAEAFGSDKFPLNRFMYTKVSYLLKRFKQVEDNGYLKKAAGPYKPKTRYGGAEKIALDNNYVKMHTSYYKGKKYENFIAGDNCPEAISYFKKWYGENALQWIQQFKYIKRDQLELWATVDMAMQDLFIANKLVNFQTVKQLINDNKEWRPKLKRPTFSDENIKSGIIKVNQLFG